MSQNSDGIYCLVESNAPLSQAIQKEFNELMRTLVLVPKNCLSEKAIDGTGGKVSVADIIAYQIGWSKLLIGWYNAGILGQVPQMPGEGFTKWDYTGLAKHFYSKYHYDGSSQQVQEFFNVVQEIITIVEHEYRTGNLYKVGIWSWCTLPSGKQWPLSKWVMVNTVSPYKRAITLIRKFIKSISS